MRKYKLKLVRKAEFGAGGDVILSFDVGIAEETLGFTQITWRESKERGKYEPDTDRITSWIDRILFKYPSLTKDEVIQAFGFIEFPDYVEFQPIASYLRVPSEREKIKEVTRIVREWFLKGIRKCEELEEQKGLEKWLWRTALATEPEFKLKPSEYLTDEDD